METLSYAQLMERCLAAEAERVSDKALIAERREYYEGVIADGSKRIEALCQRIAELEARALTVKLQSAYDLVGDEDGNCNLNEARMEQCDGGCYLRRRDVEQACAAAGITLTVGGE